MDDDDLVVDVLHAFLKELPELIEGLRDLLQHTDADAVGKQAHKIKGACAMVGALAVSAVALRMERAGRRGDLAAARGLFPDLENDYRTLFQAIGEAVPQAIGGGREA